MVDKPRFMIFPMGEYKCRIGRAELSLVVIGQPVRPGVKNEDAITPNEVIATIMLFDQR